MKLTIDDKVLKKMGLSPDLACYLISIYLDSPIDSSEDLDVFKKASKAGYIEYTRYSPSSGPKEVKLTQDGIDVLDRVFSLSKGKKGIEDDLLKRYTALAIKMQEIYPDGTKYGTHEKWRSNESIVGERILAAVQRLHLEFTDEQALQACREYVESFKNDPYKQTMRVLRYFIWKNDNGEFKSDFADYLGNINKKSINADWTTETR